MTTTTINAAPEGYVTVEAAAKLAGISDKAMLGRAHTGSVPSIRIGARIYIRMDDARRAKDGPVPPDGFVRVDEAAELAGVSAAFVQAEAREGRISRRIVGGAAYVRADDMEQYLIPEGYITIEAAAEIEGVSEGAIRGRVAEGNLGAFWRGSRYWVDSSMLEPTPPMLSDDWLTPREVAERTGADYTQVYVMMRRGELVSVRRGKRYYISPESVEIVAEWAREKAQGLELEDIGYVRVAEAARRLDVGYHWVAYQIESGKLESRKRGRAVYVPFADAERLHQLRRATEDALARARAITQRRAPNLDKWVTPVKAIELFQRATGRAFSDAFSDALPTAQIESLGRHIRVVNLDALDCLIEGATHDTQSD